VVAASFIPALVVKARKQLLSRQAA